MRIFFLVLIVGVAGLVAYPHVFPAPPQADRYTIFLAPGKTCPGERQLHLSTARNEALLVCLIDYARHEHGLPPLRHNSLLDDAAAGKLAAIIRCNKFSHTPCGEAFETLYRQLGYGKSVGFWNVGENLGWGSGVYASPRATVDGWLNSREHRETMFDPRWRDLGVATVSPTLFLGHPGVLLAAAEFGVRGN